MNSKAAKRARQAAKVQERSRLDCGCPRRLVIVERTHEVGCATNLDTTLRRMVESDLPPEKRTVQ